MELNVAFQFAIEGSGAQRREEAAVGSVSYFHFLASNFLRCVLFIGERLRSVLTWTRLLFNVHHCKLLFGCTESSNVSLPILGGQTGTHVVLLWPWIIVSAEKQILSIGSKRSCVCSLHSSESFWIRIDIISSRPNINILVIYKVILFDFTICASEKLKIILLLLLVKITLLINILISAWLDSALQELLLHLVIFLLLCLVLLVVFAQELLTNTVTRVISFSFSFLKSSFLFEDSTNHFHSDRLSLLIVVSWPRKIFLSVFCFSDSFRSCPVVRWSLLSGVVDLWIVLTWT